MQPLIYHVATTVDGYIASLEHGIEGFLEQGEHVTDYLESIQHYDTVLMGRRTYEFGYQYGLQPGDVPYPHLNNWVFSQTLDTSNFNDSGLKVYAEPDSVQQVKRIKQDARGPVWLCGGGAFAASLFQADLIDQVIIKLNPTLLGTGIPLFQQGMTYLKRLELKGHKVYQNGVMRLHYYLLSGNSKS